MYDEALQYTVRMRFLSGFAMLLLLLSYMLGSIFVIVAPGLLHLAYFTGGWYVGLLLASPALLIIFALFNVKPAKTS
jgi:hypothetical protein